MTRQIAANFLPPLVAELHKKILQSKCTGEGRFAL